MGTIAELQGKPDRLYPLLWLSNEGGSLEDNYKVDNIRLTMFGRVIAGEEGQDDDASEIEVLSDMQLILLDFLNYFHQQHGQEYVTDKAATLEHFTERTNDRTAGYSCVLELKQFYDWNKCQIPQSGASIPPSVDGLTLYDFCDQSVIDRLTATQVSCLEDEFGGVCVDATVHNSDNSYSTTVASGGDLPLPDNVITLKDTAANVLSTTNVPATNAADIEAPDGTVQIYNSVPTLLLTQGVASGGTESPTIGDSRVQNNATPTWTDTVEAEGTLTLAQAKAFDSDGATTLLADYIPAADGFMFTCTPGSSASLSVGAYSDAGFTTPITEGDALATVYLKSVPTDFTPTSYLFFYEDVNGDLWKIYHGANDNTSWTITNAVLGAGGVYCIATEDGDNWIGNDLDFEVTGDVDAYAFISAAGITDTTQQSAITTLVLQLKADSIWSKFHAIYPVVGGTASAHKYNLKDPRDLDAAFRLTFSGGITHASTGMTPNGSNGYADTHLIPLSVVSANSVSIAYYSRTNINESSVDMGSYANTTNVTFLIYNYAGVAYKGLNSSQGNRGSLFTPTTGLLIGSRINGTVEKYYQNGSLIDTLNVAATAPSPVSIFLMALDFNGSPANYTTKECAFSFIADGFTDTEAANAESAIQAFQTTLGRNV